MYTSFIESFVLMNVNLLLFRFHQVRTDCTDTIDWNNGRSSGSNGSKIACNTYASGYCSNGSFMASMSWAGGSPFRYPELNCCVCGKGWPLWSIPRNGSTATQATLQLLSNTTSRSLQCQSEGYGDIGACSMECKTINNSNMTASMDAFIADDFKYLNCTLVLQSSNTTDNNSYLIQILSSNNLIYFSNSSTTNTQLLCNSNILSSTTTSVMCRFIYRQQSFNNTECLSTTITSRSIPPGCVDTIGWVNSRASSPTGRGYTCFEYEVVWQLCANSNYTGTWGSGVEFNYPEYSCCACGKGISFSSLSLAQNQTPILNVTVTDLQVVFLTSCTTTYFGSSSIFNITCYGPGNFLNLTSPSNFTLYSCPLTCFSSTTIDNAQISTVPPVSLFNFVILCPAPGSILKLDVSSTFTSVLPTSTLIPSSTVTYSTYNDQASTSSVMTTSTQTNWPSLTELSSDRSSASPAITTSLLDSTSVESLISSTESDSPQLISSLPTLSSTVVGSTLINTEEVKQSIASYLSNSTIFAISIYDATKVSSVSKNVLSTAVSITVDSTVQLWGWKAPVCSNGQLGLNCTVSSEPCIMATPCLNNGTCFNNNSSSYNCSCIHGLFSGTFCQIDIQSCQSVTCLNHGVCIEKNFTSFECICESGYEGDHCNTLIDYCQGVICQNNAPCRSLLLNFTCECLTNDFSGRYCERKSSSLTIHQIINRSFAFVAILAMISAMSFVIIMDFLKFLLHIDPVNPIRLRIQRNQALTKGKCCNPQQPKIAIRFVYIDAPNTSSSAQVENKINVKSRV